MYAVRTSGYKSVSCLPPSSGTLILFYFLATQRRELKNFSPDVLTAWITADPLPMRFSDDLFLICGLAEPLPLLLPLVLGLVFWFCWRVLIVGWLAAPLLRRLTLRLVSLRDRRLRLRESLLLVVLPSRKRTWNSRKFKVNTAYGPKRTSLWPHSNRDTTLQSIMNAKLIKQRF